MPHDRDEKPTPAPEAAPAFDPDRLPRSRPNFMLTPDEPGANRTLQEPAPAPARETAPEFDPDNLPRVRAQFRLTPDDLAGKRAARKPAPAPAPRKRTGQDWRARTLAQRADESPPRAEEPASESQTALRAFLEAGEAEPELEAPLAEDEQDRPA